MLQQTSITKGSLFDKVVKKLIVIKSVTKWQSMLITSACNNN